MKKLLTLFLCLVLTLSLALVAGCNDDKNSSFGGDYKEATKEEVLAFASDIEESAYEIDFSKGISLNAQISSSSSEGSTEVEMSLKSLLKDGSFKMAGVINGTESGVVEGETIEESGVYGLYYDANKYYYYEKEDGEETKTVKELDYQDVLPLANMNFGYALSNIKSLNIMIERQFAMYGDGVEYSMEATETSTKIKIAFNGDVEQGGATGSADVEVVFVFDANKQLVGFSMESEVSGSHPDYGEMTNVVSLTIEAFDGEIELPSDLDSYTAAA